MANLLMDKLGSSWRRKVKRKCLLNILIEKYKRAGFIVETQLKASGDYQYFEMSKSRRVDTNEQIILNEKMLFDISGEKILSDYLLREKQINNA